MCSEKLHIRMKVGRYDEMEEQCLASRQQSESLLIKSFAHSIELLLVLLIFFFKQLVQGSLTDQQELFVGQC